MRSVKVLPPRVKLSATSIAPVTPSGAVPVKVRVAALKLSQLGSAVPSASVAVTTVPLASGFEVNSLPDSKAWRTMYPPSTLCCSEMPCARLAASCCVKL